MRRLGPTSEKHRVRDGQIGIDASFNHRAPFLVIEADDLDLDVLAGEFHLRSLVQLRGVRQSIALVEDVKLDLLHPHQGVFIPHDRVVHMHVRTPDQRMAGHVDQMRIVGDAQLHLPRVR